MKKLISIGVTAFVFLSVFVVLDIVPVPIVTATGDPHNDGSGNGDNVPGDDIWATDGDWIVDFASSVFTYENCTIIVNGNLNVTELFTLTLKNVTLLMNPPSNGTYSITVESSSSPVISGGTLIIEDIDGNSSEIASNTPFRFGFVVEGDPVNQNGNLEMRNSQLRDCGWDLTGDYKDGGLWIGGNALVDNNEIFDSYAGIIINGTENAIITNNTIHNNMESGILIRDTFASSLNPLVIGPGNNVTNNYWGIYVSSSTNISIHNNSITGNGVDGESGGLRALTSNDIWIQDNNISDNAEYSVDIENSNDIRVLGNELNGSDFTRFYMISGLEIRNNYICQGGDSAFSTNILAMGATNFIFKNNIVIDNVGIGALFNFCVVDIINNSFENNAGGGFALSLGSYNSSIYKNIIRFNGDMGLHIVGNNITISENLFEGNGDGIPFMGDPMWQDCGLDIMNSYDIFVTRNWFVNNTKDISGHVDGIYLLGTASVTTVYMEGNIMDQNDYNLHARGGVLVIDSNSTYNKSSLPATYDAYLEYDSSALGPNDIYVINTTFDNSSVYIDNPNSGTFTAQWYKHLLVEYGGSPASGASVWINDSSSNPEPSSGQPFITDSEGRIKYIPLTEFSQDNIGKTFQTPHSIDVVEGSRVSFDIADMWHSHYNTIMLSGIPNVTALRTESGPTASVYRNNPITIEAESDDTEDNDETKLTPHFEYRVNGASPWVNETEPGTYLLPASKIYTGSGENVVWSIDFALPTTAPLDTYDFRVRFNDTSPIYSGWFVVNDMVDVLNNPPEAEDINESDSFIYREDTKDIYSDAFDIEDIDENDTWNAELEYRLNQSGSWESAYITGNAYDSLSGNWSFEFSPPGTRPNPHDGLVDFRVKFQDTDGNWSSWHQEDDLIFLYNNIPNAMDLEPGYAQTYRGQSIWIFANVSDTEEIPESLLVEFWVDEPGGGVNWEKLYLSGQTWDPSGFWKILFTPPSNASLGGYNFMIRVTDADGDYSEFINNSMVEVLNNIPFPVDITPSKSIVNAGSQSILIHVNASDIEDAEDLLNIIVQWQYNETTPSGIWDSSNISLESYEGTPDSGWLRVKFNLSSNMDMGHYDFRAKVTDTDGISSTNPEWVYSFRSVEVILTEPSLDDIKLGAAQVFRNQTLYIFLNCSDPLDREGEMTPEIEYMAPNGGWISIPGSEMHYEDTNGNPSDDIGYWVIEFTPGISFILGDYQFRARVNNTDQEYSNGGVWNSTINSALVMNNLPTASNLRIEGLNTIERGDIIYIYGDGEDIENEEDQLISHFEYRAEGGFWEDTNLVNLQHITGVDSWRITFSPPADDSFLTGLYDFRVWFEDTDGDNSSTFQIFDIIEVLNDLPEVDDLNIPASGYRLQTIYITANGTDAEKNESSLTPNFQYRGPNDSNWISYGDSGSYLTGIPQYINNYWRIEFVPTAEAECGNYSFRVQFSDGNDTSQWMTLQDSFHLKNNLPTVQIIAPVAGKQIIHTLTFITLAQDTEDSALTYMWDFGDESPLSYDLSPIHNFTENRSYIVTVTVHDTDGGTAEDRITIIIPMEIIQEEPDDKDEEPGSDMVTLLLLLIIIIVVIILLMLLLMKKKKTGEELPLKEHEGGTPEITDEVPPQPPPPPEVPMEGVSEPPPEVPPTPPEVQPEVPPPPPPLPPV